MGKSDKKAKSDKINALRKQYEAFLDEDKQRKERNEYILGRLDEMRSYTAVVAQIKPKLAARQLASFHNSERSVITIKSPKHIRSYPTPLPLDNPTKTSEETFLLQEIAKKYILIPKRDYYDSRHSVDDNNDWQNKYDILNHIKDIDKEDKIPSHPDEAMYRTEIDRELPVKDISGNRVKNIELKSHERGWENDAKDIKMTPNIDENVSSSYHYFEDSGIANIFNTDLNSKAINKIADPSNEDVIASRAESLSITSPTECKDVSITYERLQTLYSKPAIKGLHALPLTTDLQKSKIKTKELEQKQNFCSPIEKSNNLDIADDFVKPNRSQNEDDEEYPMEIINVSDFTPNVGVTLEDGVNINPEGYHLYEAYSSASNDGPQTDEIETQQMQSTQNIVNTEETEKSDPEQSDINNDGGGVVDFDKDQIQSESVVVESTIDQNAIEEFETEQMDMFYENQPDENAAYQQEAEGYNSGVNYQENEYQYYEGGQEQGPPVEINEHEETTELYDPNYEAQYGTAYQQQTVGYDQQQGYEQQQQAYQQHQEGYPQQPGYDQQGEFNQQQEYVQEQREYAQEQQNQQYLEQQLDYAEQQQEYVQEQTEYVQQQQEYVQEQPDYVNQQQEYIQERPDYVQQQEYSQHQQEEYDQQQVFDEGQQKLYGAVEVLDDQQTGYEHQLYDQQSYEQGQYQQQHYETSQNAEEP